MVVKPLLPELIPNRKNCGFGGLIVKSNPFKNKT
jgi:hypothetical protein